MLPVSDPRHQPSAAPPARAKAPPLGFSRRPVPPSNTANVYGKTLVESGPISIGISSYSLDVRSLGQEERWPEQRGRL